jgi:RHS repeat-associated protein
MSKRFVKCLIFVLCVSLVAGPTLSLAGPPLKEARSDYLPLRPAPSSRAKRVNRSIHGRPQAEPGAVGQTTTVLADGRLLLLGGETEDGPSATAFIRDVRTGEVTVLPTIMYEARAWHSATMLPNGRVLVLGGIGPNGQILGSAELFNPEEQSFELLSPSRFSARAHHTATLLTNGTVLIAGGVSDKGQGTTRAELWDFRSGTLTKINAPQTATRKNHRATLLPDGNVLFEGGVQADGKESVTAELYNSETGEFLITTLSSADSDPAAAPFVSASSPRDGATDVSSDDFISLRFSKALLAETINDQSIRLSGSEGQITAKVVAAESGRLAFIKPNGSLLSDATYTLSILGAKTNSTEIIGTSITFTTKGQKPSDKETPSNPIANQPDWTPDSSALRGNWKTNREKSSWQDLAPLQAAPDETALAGQALTLTGQPLANVTLRIGEKTAQTDTSGRFLLRAIGKGHQVLVIDGRTANERGRVYGTFRVGIEVKEKITNVLPFRIWMPRLDMGHAVSVTSPTTGETIITNPLIPGLELRLPQGTSIRDLDGNLVTQISITPVPTDRPPFPLPPGFNVPVFASIQPGGARVIPPRAQLIYPNYTNERAGARIDFWNYDPEEKGWYIYGQGTVSANGKQIIPDPGVVIYEFTGIMISSGGSPPWWWPFGDSEDGDPVDLASGLFVLEKTDLVLPDTIPLSLTRVYRPADNVSRAFGIGSSHPYDMFLWSVNNYQQTDLILPNGGRVHYVRISPGTGWGDAIYEHTETTGPFYKSRISWNGGGWDLKLRDGTVYVFPEYAPLRYIRDRYGNQITINRSGSNITEITSPHGRWIQFTYDSNRITQARDNIGRAVNYAYDTSGRLWRVTDPNGGITEYTYDTSNRMRTIKDARGIVYLTNEYDANGRVFRQTQADNSIYQFAYTLDTNGKVTQTDVTDPRGFVRRVTFNSSGYVLTDTHALGRPEQQIVTLERQSGTNLPLSVIDPLNHRTNYVYDSMGNVTSVTDLAGTPDAVTMTFTYDPLYNQPLSATDALNHTTNFNYDGLGKLIGITNPLNDQVTFEYNTAGQMISMSNAMGHTTGWAYDGADLVSLTNPLGHVSRRFVDAIGRPISTTDALGHVNKFTYDVLNQIVQATNAAGGNTSFTYDPNGNLLTVTDPRNSVTTYTYDSMDRIATRKDPLLREESYIYDGNGNLTQFTDRNGQITSYSYDALDRLTLVTYADTSTTSFVYDAANRLTQAVDSISGSISLTYDNLDRTTSETTAYGSASYTYDDADRRTSMTVTGQPTINYSHDNANRLTGITQGQTSVSYSYDAAGRRSSITLPNGVVGDYGYDVGSNLTSLTYRQGVNVIGNLTYEYNALRARTKVGGSLARTISTPALPLGTYNAANQLVQRGTTTYTYDNNGNLLNDGTNTYSWDARSQLTSISGGASASFQYDSFGRRTGKTVNSQSSQYLYDGSRVVQELSGGVPTANMLLGLGVDERHSCSCSGSNSSFLTDVLGSALALTDSSGAVQTQYTYDAFGNTASSGAASSNSSQYTGRENDGTGLYYYRARYYSPALQRFISQDPIGFAGDDTNLYAYVGNNPINLSDPFGTNPLAAAGAVCLEGAIIGAATDALINALTGRKITLSGLGRSALMGCGMALIGLGLGRALGAAMRMFGRGAGGGTNVVYQSVNAAGEVNYVGITNNLGRRAAEHLASPRALQINPIPGLNNLSRADARAVEQVLIETHGLARNSGTLLNRINSIARTNPAYADAIRRGTEILRRAGYPGF